MARLHPPLRIQSTQTSTAQLQKRVAMFTSSMRHRPSNSQTFHFFSCWIRSSSPMVATLAQIPTMPHAFRCRRITAFTHTPARWQIDRIVICATVGIHYLPSSVSILRRGRLIYHPPLQTQNQAARTGGKNSYRTYRHLHHMLRAWHLKWQVLPLDQHFLSKHKQYLPNSTAETIPI